MKIIQISPVLDSDGHVYVYGLSDTNKVYVWKKREEKWKLETNKPRL